jgi:hypothetical protein
MAEKTDLDRRRFLVAAAATGAACTWPGGSSKGSTRKSLAPKPRLGINLALPSDFATELPFVDVARLAKDWVSQREGAPWGHGPPLALDKDGWVQWLQPGCSADTFLMSDIGAHVPAGIYTLHHKGKGKLECVGSGVKTLTTAPGQIRLQVAETDVFRITLRETDPHDYVRELQVVRPGFETSFRTEPWDPAFLARWRGVAVLRLTSFQHVGDSKLQQWSDRPRLESATFASKGVPVELLVDLANRLQADPWFSMPHLADDDFVRQFAVMVRERLDPARSIWLEYSNETWNGIFEQHHYAAEQGRRRGLALRAWDAAVAYTAVRSLEIFRIWEDVFGGNSRLVRVLPSQAANTFASESVLKFRHAGDHADVLAIAPYFMLMPNSTEQPVAKEVAGWSLDKLFDHLEQTRLPEAIGWMRASKAVADRYGLRLVAYEGGQHLVEIPQGGYNEALTRLFLEANAHPRMGQLYRQYLDAWVAVGGDLFCHFDSVSRWGWWGSWGLLQHHDDRPEASPKFMATIAWAQSRGQAMTVSGKVSGR